MGGNLLEKSISGKYYPHRVVLRARTLQIPIEKRFDIRKTATEFGIDLGMNDYSEGHDSVLKCFTTAIDS